MNGIGSWFRRIGAQMSAGIRRFMEGRYGTDRLNMVILCAGLVASLVSVWCNRAWICMVFFFLSYGLMIWAIYRSLSRQTYKRYQENRRFCQMIDRIKDRQHRYFECPKCHQPVRVPRGKGKISITCPKCHERFVRKT